jgi:hypothetical protein
VPEHNVKKKVAILQSNYIPWKGYFNIIKYVDAFVLLDDVQFTRRDWRNRNLIKTKEGLKWLTIPVNIKGQYLASIKDITTSDNLWRTSHWNQITSAYRKTAYFELYEQRFKELYLNDDETNLSSINSKFLREINELLQIATPIKWSMEFDAPAEKTERLIHICQVLNADIYVSGPAAKDYLRVDAFKEHNIEVKWVDYSDYPIYDQHYPPFEHGVSIIDLLFHKGPDSISYLKDKL